MPRWLLCCMFVVALGCCGRYCYGQAPDSTARKLPFWERPRRALEDQTRERMRDHHQRMEAWRNRPLLKADSPRRWSLSFNAPGLLELQMAIGLGVGYQLSSHWQIWLESSALGQFYQKPEQSCIGGVREILAMKFYFGPQNTLFFAGEFRWKQVYYHDVENFASTTTSAELKNYTYQLENIVFGGAVWFGARIRISQNHRWRLEPSIGLGVKGRTVVWHGVPEGYQYYNGGLKYDDTFSTSPRFSTPATIYAPASVRVVYVL